MLNKNKNKLIREIKYISEINELFKNLQYLFQLIYTSIYIYINKYIK